MKQLPLPQPLLSLKDTTMNKVFNGFQYGFGGALGVMLASLCVSLLKLFLLVGFLIFFYIILIFCVSFKNVTYLPPPRSIPKIVHETPTLEQSNTQPIAKLYKPKQKQKPTITLNKYTKLKYGMSQADVKDLFQCGGKQTIPGVYSWTNKDDSCCTVIFRDNKLTSKSQLRLKRGD